MPWVLYSRVGAYFKQIIERRQKTCLRAVVYCE